MKRADLIVVGGGPAGLAAATAAGGRGLRVLMLDEAPAPGGRYFGPLAGHNATRPQSRPGLALLERARRAGVQVMSDTAAWSASRAGDIFRVWMSAGNGGGMLESPALVLATGAYDRPHPFPGWTLPGVVTAGGLQQLVKRTGVAPRGRIVLAGTGPFLLPVAATLVEHGVRPAAVFDSAGAAAWVRFGIGALRRRSHLGEGLGYARHLAPRGALPLTGWRVARALGDDRLREVVMRSSDGRRQMRLRADLLALGYGFLSQVELSAVLGCEMRFDALQRQWVPVARETVTGVPGLFLCGDGAVVRGFQAAVATGRLAGEQAAAYLGRGRLQPATRKAAREAAGFGLLVASSFPPPDPLPWATPDTIVCRCEDVALAEIADAAGLGADSTTAVKAWCRAGQGPCQGRNCSGTVAAIIAATRRIPLADALRPSIRPPVRPVPLQDVAAAANPP